MSHLLSEESWREIRKDNLMHMIDAKITDPNIRLWLNYECIPRFPDAFWSAPASGTGKYHPEDENTSGGLVKHVFRVVEMVEHMVDFHDLNDRDRDILMAATVLHDALAKSEQSLCTEQFHALRPYKRFDLKTAQTVYQVEKQDWEDIMECVTSHEARWSQVPQLNIDKKLPNIFKICDFVASRRNIKVQL